MNYLDSMNYKHLHYLYSYFKNDYFMNIIIYGKDRNKYNEIINLFQLLNRDIIIINDYNEIYNYINTKNILDTHKLLLLNKIKINQYHQIELKNLIEKKYDTIKFIILIDNLNEIIYIKDLFFIYYYSNQSKYEMIIDNKNQIKIDEFYKKIYQKIMNIYNKKKINIHKIKELCYKIKLLNININDFLKTFLDQIFLEDFKNDKIIQIIKLIAEYEYLIKKSYRELIYLESLFISIYKILYIE